MAEIVVLLSAGRHPATGCPRPAVSDAQALQLARSLGAQGHQVTALHAGPDDAPLRAYAGYGLADLVRLDLPAEADPVPALTTWLAMHRPALVLAGARAEHGAATGLLPYALARALGGACIPDAVAVESLADRITLIQAREGGRRRRLAAPAPAVLTVAHAAPAASGWAYARAARAAVTVAPAMEQPQPAAMSWRTEPARPLARPVRKVRGGAAARMAAATSFTAGKGRLLVQPAPEEAARAILDYLEAEGLLRR
jgi:electron transfer flavoprotein beta subunit